MKLKDFVEKLNYLGKQNPTTREIGSEIQKLIRKYDPKDEMYDEIDITLEIMDFLSEYMKKNIDELKNN